MPRLSDLQIKDIFLGDAADLKAARVKSRIIHHTKDIDSAGAEVEIAARNFFKRRLPNAYYVNQGHIVDSKLNTSPQLDIIIADTTLSPVLFSTEDNTEYFPFESVYAVGEIKSTYSKKEKQIEKFCETIEAIRTGLHRAATPTSYISKDLKLGGGLKISGAPEPKNPLFFFMLFVDSGDFKPKDLDQIYTRRPLLNLPTIICFLDSGIMIHVEAIGPEDDLTLMIKGLPEQLTEAEQQKMNWVFNGVQDSAGINLALLHFALLEHLERCVLMLPPMKQYLAPLLSLPKNEYFIFEKNGPKK